MTLLRHGERETLKLILPIVRNFVEEMKERALEGSGSSDMERYNGAKEVLEYLTRLTEAPDAPPNPEHFGTGMQ